MRTLALLLSALTIFPQISSGAPSPVQLLPRLQRTEYPRLASQSDDAHIYVEPDQFGDPIGETTIVDSLHPWRWNQERNAIAKGILVVETDGEYAFTTESFYNRTLLMIDGEIALGFAAGADKVVTLDLKKGLVEIASVGYYGSRGSSKVRWRPPGQRELSAIPGTHLRHYGKPRSSELPAEWMTVVAKDFVVDVYKNGKRIPDSKREALLDRFGATVERIHENVRPGDWIVFHVVNNRLRHGGTKFFAVAGTRKNSPFSFVSDPESEQWSVCDDPARADPFIRERDDGTEARATSITKPWEEGMKFMREYAGNKFPGKPLWGIAPSTWIKFVAPSRRERARL